MSLSQTIKPPYNSLHINVISLASGSDLSNKAIHKQQAPRETPPPHWLAHNNPMPTVEESFICQTCPTKQKLPSHSPQFRVPGSSCSRHITCTQVANIMTTSTKIATLPNSNDINHRRHQFGWYFPFSLYYFVSFSMMLCTNPMPIVYMFIFHLS